MKITITKFPTHIAKTDNKIAPNKMIKINNQAIYNSNLNRFARNIVMNNLHNYLKKGLKPNYKLFKSANLKYPYYITLHIYTVKNHGSISMRKGKMCWKPAKNDYEPNWDIENLATIWIKAFNDTLTKEGFIKDDNIQYLTGISYKYHEVEDVEDRKFVIEINEED